MKTIGFKIGSIPAGFPSPAMDFTEDGIDLNKELAENPEATFLLRVSGHSMNGAGIDDKDILVVDRSVEPRDGRIAICVIDGSFTVKRLQMRDGKIMLLPENESFEPIQITAENEFSVWGIVTYVIKKL